MIPRTLQRSLKQHFFVPMILVTNVTNPRRKKKVNACFIRRQDFPRFPTNSPQSTPQQRSSSADRSRIAHTRTTCERIYLCFEHLTKCGQISARRWRRGRVTICRRNQKHILRRFRPAFLLRHHIPFRNPHLSSAQPATTV